MIETLKSAIGKKGKQQVKLIQTDTYMRTLAVVAVVASLNAACGMGHLDRPTAAAQVDKFLKENSHKIPALTVIIGTFTDRCSYMGSLSPIGAVKNGMLRDLGYLILESPNMTTLVVRLTDRGRRLSGREPVSLAKVANCDRSVASFDLLKYDHVEVERILEESVHATVSLVGFYNLTESGREARKALRGKVDSAFSRTVVSAAATGLVGGDILGSAFEDHIEKRFKVSFEKYDTGWAMAEKPLFPIEDWH